jgi:hypothetical protein
MSGDVHYSQARQTATIWPIDSLRHAQLAELLQACDYDVVDSERAADYLLADISSISGQTHEDYSKIADYLNRYGAQALIWIGMDQLDTVFAALPVEQCHFLIDADDALALTLLAQGKQRGKMDQLHDRSRDGDMSGDYGALHKISDELADFARTLARIAEQEGTLPSSLSDKPVSFRPAPSAIFEPLVPADKETKAPTASAIRDLIKLRRMREQHFPPALFADPGWDILLDLFAAKQEGKAVSVSSLCIAAAVPPTTALRWVTTMTEHGALIRRQDPNDARRVFIELSEDSEERLLNFFRQAEAKGGLII